MRRRWIGVVMAVVLTAGCGPGGFEAPGEPTAESPPTSPESIWSMDLIRTLPGGREAYLQNIEANRASARDLARQRGLSSPTWRWPLRRTPPGDGTCSS